jgi:hypothetical protein
MIWSKDNVVQKEKYMLHLSGLLRVMIFDQHGRAWMVTHVRDECEPSLWDDPAPGSVAAVTVMHAGRYITLRLHTEGGETTLSDVAKELHRFVTTDGLTAGAMRDTRSS